MNKKILWLCLVALVPCLAFAATRDGARVGMRAPAAPMVSAPKAQSVPKTSPKVAAAPTQEAEEENTDSGGKSAEKTMLGGEECRNAYRECMDEFCQLDESEGGRCSCSDNIKQSKSLIQEIQKIQQEAEKLYTEGVEKERLGAKAKFVKFGESDKAKKSSRASGVDLVAWINGTGSESLSADDEIGDNLYSMAADSCEYILADCDSNRASMEEKLYQREIVKDCKVFDGYLSEQKAGAESNKRTAEAAVRAALVDMLPTTNKYNRGECLQAYTACISDKGGCGVNFENCLDADLLARRANSCENILDQCTEAKNYVLQDWEAESQMLLEKAATYTDENMRLTCRAKIRNCLEEGCNTSTDSACLNNINVAAGVCPIIDECNDRIPGLKNEVQAELAELRTNFCQNDVDKCLRDKCGTNFTGPECLGKRIDDIEKLCPKSMFAACKNETNFKLIVQSVRLQMDYQMVEGCKNYYADMLGRVCGTDMNCLPKSDIVESLTKVPSADEDVRARVRAESKKAVNEFFKQFNTESTVAACRSGSGMLNSHIFKSAQMVAEIAAANRYMADLESKLMQLQRADARVKSRDACLNTYKVESKPKDTDENRNYSYIKSVSFEASLCNCHVCRMQRVCATDGESKLFSAAKYAAGGLAGGASAGYLGGGWGAAIIGGLGAIGGAYAGYQAGGEKEFCQEIESCEDIDVSDVDGGCRGEN